MILLWKSKNYIFFFKKLVNVDVMEEFELDIIYSNGKYPLNTVFNNFYKILRRRKFVIFSLFNFISSIIPIRPISLNFLNNIHFMNDVLSPKF